VGVINDVTRVISNELKVNMKSVTISSDNGIFEGEIQVYVNDTDQLETLKKKLELIEGVEQVKRFDIT
jgi:GTP pyrophosphokinase